MARKRRSAPTLLDEVWSFLDEPLKDLPGQILERLIDKKLLSNDQRLPPEAKAALVQHILSGSEDPFSWSDGGDGGDVTLISLSFDDADLSEIDIVKARLVHDVPEAIFDELSRQSHTLFKSLKAKWKKERALQDHEVEGFKGRLRQRWGTGINLLKMMLTISREFGQEAVNEYREPVSAEHSVKLKLLARLHARACQVTEEIICLLEGGLAEGAMARWRTLHELAVVSTVIADGDDNLAERFMLHEIIEEWDHLKELRLANPARKVSKVEARREADLQARYDALLLRYEEPYGGLYGWAAAILKSRKPTFKMLQELAEKIGERSHYKLASYNVHAGARGTLHRLTSLGARDVLLAGRSNAGLAEPGRNAAFSFTQITGTILGTPETVDDIVAMKVLLLVRDAAQRAFERADQKLRRDERALASR